MEILSSSEINVATITAPSIEEEVPVSDDDTAIEDGEDGEDESSEDQKSDDGSDNSEESKE